MLQVYIVRHYATASVRKYAHLLGISLFWKNRLPLVFRHTFQAEHYFSRTEQYDYIISTLTKNSKGGGRVRVEETYF